MVDRHLDELIHAVLDDTASAEQRAELNRRLSDEPAVADRLIELSELHVMAQWLFGNPQQKPITQGGADAVAASVGDGLDRELMGELIEQALENRRLSELAERAELTLRAQQASEAAAGRHRPVRKDTGPLTIIIPRSLVWSGLAAAAVLLGLLIWSVGDRVVPTGPGPIADSPATNTEPDTIPPPTPPHNPVVARVVGALEADWETALPDGDRLHRGQAMVLRSGLVELVFNDGASVLIEGPARFEARGSNAIALTRGRLTAKVPLSAYRFEVATPKLLVVDLGTEFGVAVHSDGGGQVAVFDGLVELHAPAGSADPGEEAPAAGGIRLSAGWSRSVSAQGQIAAQADKLDHATQATFARAIDVPNLAALAYRREMLATGPVAYWAFDDLDRGVTLSLGTSDVQPLDVFGQVQLDDGPFGKALRLTGNAAGTDYLRSRRPIAALTDTQTYTISVWCRLDRRQDGRIVTLFSLDPSLQAAHRFIAGLQSTGNADRGLTVPIPVDALRFTHRDPPGLDHRTGSNIFSEDFQPGAWVHFVAVKHADRVELYRDGRRVGQAQEPGRVRGSPYVLLGISPGLFDIPERTALYQPFAGLIDELALYDRALSAEEIAGLFERSGPLLLADGP